jgi:hypothetical protein
MSIAASRLGYHQASDREIYLLNIDALGTLYQLPVLRGRHFTCFCALDARGLSAQNRWGISVRVSSA